MALTLAEAAKLSNDLVMQGVIETIIQDSPILRLLPFIESKVKTLGTAPVPCMMFRRP